MSNVFGLGGPVIKCYLADGVTLLKTLYLPAPDKNGGLVLNWKSLAKIKIRLDGSPYPYFPDSNHRYIPMLTVKYSVYDDLLGNVNGTIGTADGNTPTFEQLVSELSTYGAGRISISPGGTAPFFKCFLSKNVDQKPIKNIVYKDVVLEFTATSAYVNMVLV